MYSLDSRLEDVGLCKDEVSLCFYRGGGFSSGWGWGLVI